MRIAKLLLTLRPRIIQLTLVLMLISFFAHAQIMSSGNPAFVGQPVAFTVQIDAPSDVIATPTGTVTFQDNDQDIGSVQLQNGTAAFTTQFGSAGNHVIVADYSGDANFSPSSSPPFTEQVTADDVFTLSVSPSVITQQAGESSVVNLTVFGSGDNPGPVRFSCENLPPGVACSFTPATAVPSPNGASATVTMSSSATAHRASLPNRSPLLYAGMLMPLAIVRNRRWRRAKCMCALIVLVLAVVGCGEKLRVLQAGTPPGSYTIHVSATDGNTTQQSDVKLTVN